MSPIITNLTIISQKCHNIRVGLSEQAQMVSDKILAAKNARKKKIDK